MDPVTHALSGALIARATAPRGGRADRLGLRERTVAGLLAGAFPDVDFIVGFLDPLTYLNVHRGVTHSVLMLPFWAFLLAALFAWLARRGHTWRAYFGVCVLAIAIHIAGDVITAYGTKVLAPLSDFRLALPATFIIDPYFTGIIVIGLLLSFRFRPRHTAAAALLALAGYVGFQGLLHQQAVAIGNDYIAAQHLQGALVHALPQPLSPFHWKVIVSEGDTYHETYVNLAARKARPAPAAGATSLAHIAVTYRPPEAAIWQRLEHFGSPAGKESVVRAAWQQNEFAGFREFAELPVLYRIDQSSAGTCVWFTDLRFVLPDLTPPFRYGMCRPAEGDTWHLRRLPRRGLNGDNSSSHGSGGIG